MKLIHFGDSLAIPMFLLLLEYFYLKENKSILEYFFLLFALIGLIIDSYFTYIYVPELIPYIVILTLGIQAYTISNGWLGTHGNSLL
jgi:hypothetical protein